MPLNHHTFAFFLTTSVPRSFFHRLSAASSTASVAPYLTGSSPYRISRLPCSFRRHLSSSSTIDAAPLAHLAHSTPSHHEVVTTDVQVEKLKELSQFIVKRSPTRHFSQKQFDTAQELCDTYYTCDPEQRYRYLCFLADDFSTSLQLASTAANSFLSTQSRQEPYDAGLLIDRLRNQIRPKYLELFRYISRLDHGVKFLVDLRGDLITVLGNAKLLNAAHNPSSKVFLRLMSSELSDLLSLWFSAGFLRLERVTWDSPTSILQKISEYEAVHPVRNWIDLKNRVGLYRRCYMFSHSCLPGEPLVILHVALVPDISSSIQEIIIKTTHQASFHRSSTTTPEVPESLPPTTPTSKLFNPSSFSRIKCAPIEDPNRIDAAVFYSISSTQKGLNGIDLGHAMITQVAGELKADFTQMTQFSSLSPIPNFTEYLLSTIQTIQRQDPVNWTAYFAFWQHYTDFSRLKRYVEESGRFAAPKEGQSLESTFWARMVHLLRTGGWIADPVLVELMQEPLMRLCAHYLHNEKRRGYALNSVANFHLKNGAVMWRLNWLADTSTRGVANSCGMMINYRYFLEKTEENSQTYLNEKRIISGEQFQYWLQ